MIKTCKVCNSEFETNQSANTICSDNCREIQKQKARNKWRTKSKEQKRLWAGYTKKWRDRNPYKAKVTLLKAKALRSNLPFDLDEQWFQNNNQIFCPVLGIRLNQGDRNSVSSVDRIIPELGYVKENCRIISMKANMLKNNATVEELEKIIQYMKNNT